MLSTFFWRNNACADRHQSLSRWRGWWRQSTCMALCLFVILVFLGSAQENCGTVHRPTPAICWLYICSQLVRRIQPSTEKLLVQFGDFVSLPAQDVYVQAYSLLEDEPMLSFFPLTCLSLSRCFCQCGVWKIISLAVERFLVFISMSPLCWDAYLKVYDFKSNVCGCWRWCVLSSCRRMSDNHCVSANGKGCHLLVLQDTKWWLILILKAFVSL